MDSQETDSEGDTFEIIEMGEEYEFDLDGPNIVDSNGDPIEDLSDFPDSYSDILYTCECGESYLSQDELNLHKLLHDDENFCPECDASYDTKSEFEYDIKTHLERFSCDLCGEVFARLCELEDHGVKHTSNEDSGYFDEFLLDEQFHGGNEESTSKKNKAPKPSGAKSGTQKQIKDKPKKPKKKPTDYAELAKEIYEDLFNNEGEPEEEVDSEDDFSSNYRNVKCDQCSNTFCTVSSLMRHKVRLHGLRRNYKCRLCGLNFHSNQALLEHRDTHIQASLEHKNKKRKKGFKCMICLRVYSQKSKLFEHMDVHSENVVTCQYCKEEFTFLALQTHIRKVHKHEVCQICNESFFNKKLFFSHEKSHFKVNDNTCDYCSSIFEDQQALKDHMISEHVGNSGENKCESCPKVFYCERHLKYHKSFFHLSCHLCDKKFKEQGHLILHRKMAHSTNTDPVTCKLCLTVFPNRARLAIHLQQTHSMISVHKCKFCKKKFSKYKMLAEHMKECKKEVKLSTKITGESRKYLASSENPNEKPNEMLDEMAIDATKKYQCKHCQKAYGCYKNLKKHMLNYHRDIVIQDANIKYVTCEFCPRLFITKYELSVHVQGIHVKQRAHTCKICNKSYKYHPNLVHHMTTAHSGKKFTCEICKKDFNSDSYLKIHMASQHIEQQQNENGNSQLEINTIPSKEIKQEKIEKKLENMTYSCKLCTRVFPFESALTYHMQIHTASKMYDCKVCGQQFKSDYILSKHMRVSHYGETTLKCEFCQKTFSTGTILGLHRYRKHRDLLSPDIIAKYDANLVRCEICNQQLANRSRYKNHMKIHFRDNEVQCTMCSEKFTTKESILIHMKTAHLNSDSTQLTLVKKSVEPKEKPIKIALHNAAKKSEEQNNFSMTTNASRNETHTSNQLSFVDRIPSMLSLLLGDDRESDSLKLEFPVKTEKPDGVNKKLSLPPTSGFPQNNYDRFNMTNQIPVKMPLVTQTFVINPIPPLNIKPNALPREKLAPNNVRNMPYMPNSSVNGYRQILIQMPASNTVQIQNQVPVVNSYNLTNSSHLSSNPIYLSSNVQTQLHRPPSYNNNYNMPPNSINVHGPRMNLSYPQINPPHISFSKPSRPLYNVLYEQNVSPNTSHMPYIRISSPYTDVNMPYGNANVAYTRIPHSAPNMPQNTMNMPNSSISMPHSNMGMSQSHINMPQSNTGMPQSNTSMPQSNTGMPQSNTGMPQSNTGMPQSNTGMPQSNMGMPQSNTNMPHSNMNMPQSNMSMPQSNLNMTQSNIGIPQSNINMPQSSIPQFNMNMPHSNMNMSSSNTNMAYGSTHLQYVNANTSYGSTAMSYGEVNRPPINVNVPYNANAYTYEHKIPQAGDTHEISNNIANLPSGNLNSPMSDNVTTLGKSNLTSENNFYTNQAPKPDVNYSYTGNILSSPASSSSLNTYSDNVSVPATHIKTDDSYYGEQSAAYNMNYSYNDNKVTQDLGNYSHSYSENQPTDNYPENQPLENVSNPTVKYEDAYSVTELGYDASSATQNTTLGETPLLGETKPLQDIGMYDTSKECLPWDSTNFTSTSSDVDTQCVDQFPDLIRFGCEITPIYANGIS